MGSLGAGELVVIAIVAIVVFGPKRLPEIARKASALMKQARDATQTFTDAMDTEYDGVASPIKNLKSEYDDTMRTIKKMASPTPYLDVKLPGGNPNTSTTEDSAINPAKVPRDDDGSVDGMSPGNPNTDSIAEPQSPDSDSATATTQEVAPDREPQ
jgi:sec-independent protein translocase protein TatA